MIRRLNLVGSRSMRPLFVLCASMGIAVLLLLRSVNQSIEPRNTIVSHPTANFLEKGPFRKTEAYIKAELSSGNQKDVLEAWKLLLNTAGVKKSAVATFKEQALLWNAYLLDLTESNRSNGTESEVPSGEIRTDLTRKIESSLNNCSLNYTKAMIAVSKSDIYRNVSDLLQLKPYLSLGGHYTPPCKPADFSKVVIIIPYRDRESHLTNFLAYMIPVWISQQIEFRIIVAEQFGNETFNKGRLMNAAVEYALRRWNIGCLIFHDVDQLPQSNHQRYDCLWSPFHFTPFFEEFKFVAFRWSPLLGGASALTPDHFARVNGWSNLFWGYGGEDQEFADRVVCKLKAINSAKNGTDTGKPGPIALRYFMLPHKKRGYQRPGHAALATSLIRSACKLLDHDGFKQKLWRIHSHEVKDFYHHIFVDVGPPPKSWTD